MKKVNYITASSLFITIEAIRNDFVMFTKKGKRPSKRWMKVAVSQMNESIAFAIRETNFPL